MMDGCARNDCIKQIDASMAILDAQGTIVGVNGVWKRIAEVGGLDLQDYGIGSSYFDHWPPTSGEAARHQLRSILQGTAPVFTWLYPCRMPDGLKRFLLLALPVSRREARGAVVWHLNVTPLFPVGFDDDGLVSRPLDSGLPVDGIVEAVTGAVINALKGTPLVANHVGRQGNAAKPEAIANRLTARQQEVFRLLGDGLTNSEIAGTLGTSENTIRIHVSAILKRLGLKTRLQAAVTAARLPR